MSESYEKALAETAKFTNNVDEALLKVLAKNYAITQANPDTANVACSDSKELDTVRENFAKKKLGVEGDQAAAAIRAVCEDMASARMKNRIVFYYLLTKKLGRESAFV